MAFATFEMHALAIKYKDSALLEARLAVALAIESLETR